MLRLFVFLTAVLVVRAQAQTTVNRCTFHEGELPTNVHIDGCSTPPCDLPQLQDAVIDITFKAPRSIEHMTTLATIFLLPLPIAIPYDLGTNAVTCNFLQNTSCPVSEREEVQYQLKTMVDEFFPIGILANIEFRIVDASDNSPITCFRLPIRVVPPVPRLAA